MTTSEYRTLCSGCLFEGLKKIEAVVCFQTCLRASLSAEGCGVCLILSWQDVVPELESESFSARCRQPVAGTTGRILASYESHAVRFDEEVPGGSDLRGMCEPGRGQVCYCEKHYISKESSLFGSSIVDTQDSRRFLVFFGPFGVSNISASLCFL